MIRMNRLGHAARAYTHLACSSQSSARVLSPTRPCYTPLLCRSAATVPLRTARKLPEPASSKRRLAAYAVLASVLGVSIVIAFNHQRASSGICHSTYWAVKRDPIARELLGEHITYRDYWPWVTGEINQIKGNIQFSYAVKGDKQAGTVHFHCIRRTRNSQDWQILDWRLVADDGTDVALTPDKVEPAA